MQIYNWLMQLSLMLKLIHQVGFNCPVVRYQFIKWFSLDWFVCDSWNRDFYNVATVGCGIILLPAKRVVLTYPSPIFEPSSCKKFFEFHLQKNWYYLLYYNYISRWLLIYFSWCCINFGVDKKSLKMLTCNFLLIGISIFILTFL